MPSPDVRSWAPAVPALMVALRAPTAGLALGWLVIRWPVGAALVLMAYLAWMLLVTVSGVRRRRRVAFGPLAMLVMLVLFLAVLFGIVAGIGIGAGKWPWLALAKAYLCAFSAWLMMLAGRRWTRPARRHGTAL